jgi:hypothetical protein
MQMPNTAEAGRVFIREGTRLPEALQLETEPYVAGWRLVKNLDWPGLGRKLHEAGWTFSCTAAEINVTVFGLDEQNTVRRAIARTLANPRPEKFNSLEITRVATAASKRFPEVCYVTASARSRHIQESTVLLSDKAVPRWESRKILDDSSPVTVLRGRQASHFEEEVVPEVVVDVCQVIKQRLEELGIAERRRSNAGRTKASRTGSLQSFVPTETRRKMADATILQYLGFRVNDLVREYAFAVLGTAAEPLHYTLTIANEAFASHGVRYQDAPDICSRRLHRELDAYANHPPTTSLCITDAELAIYQDARRPKVSRSAGTSRQSGAKPRY